MRKYVAYKITAENVYGVYEEYKEWIDKINQKESAKIVIVSTNLVQNSAWCCMIITYYYQ